MEQTAALCGFSLWSAPPWLPPGGSCHDEISASRNRYFVVTDEGWRELKVSTAVCCFVETKANATHPAAFLNQPVATPHQPGLPVPKCRQSRQLPPGGSQGEFAEAGTIQCTHLFQKQWLARHPYHIQNVCSCNFPGFLECPGASGTPPGRNCNYCSSSSLSMMSVLISILGRWKGPLKVEPLVEGMVGRPSRRR